MKKKLFWMIATVLLMNAQPSLAARFGSPPPAPLYPVSPLIVLNGVDTMYPSVAGDFLVYSSRVGKEFRVSRVSRHSPVSAPRSIKTMVHREAIRFGVAIKDGSVGYVSNRSGPITSWMWQGHGESHVAIGHLGDFRGTVAPYHLNATPDGKVWVYDTSLQKVRQNQMLNEFVKYPHVEVIGQLWRSYDSESFRHKTSYLPTKAGRKNDLFPPVLYIVNRTNAQLSMIPNAFDGTISPDGKRVVFVRETNGNYDLWMQTINGGELVQLTDSMYGDFEPQFSPDGSKLLFVSNRDYGGEVTDTSIYMLDMQSFKIKRLTNASNAIDGGPAWLDNNTIVFHSDRSLKEPQSKVGSDWNIWQLKLN